jgi:hypothetical protein
MSCRCLDAHKREETSRSMRRFFIRREPPLADPLPQENKTAAVLSVFLFGGNLRIKPPLHELPLLFAHLTESS